MLKNVLIKKNNLNGQIYMKIYLRRIFLRNLQMKILKHLMELFKKFTDENIKAFDH